MRKIFTITLLTISSLIYGQLQNFNSGVFPPVSPNTVTTPVWAGGTWSGNPSTWYRSDDLVVNGSMGNNGLNVGFGGSGNCAVLYSNMFEGYQCCGFQVDMIINNVNLTSYTAPCLKFYVKHPDGDEEIQIAASNMGGAYTLLQTINSNYADWTMVTIDLSAYAGSNDLTLRFRGVSGPMDNSDQTNVGIDEVLIADQTNMVYVSSTTNHVGCGLKQGFDNQTIMRIDVTTQGNLNPINLTSFLMNTNGSTDDCNDILNKKIYATGTSNVFNTSNLVGSSDLTGNYTVSNTIALNEGTNYFWVTGDISSTSTLSNLVDAECTGLVINGNTETPLITAPAGNLIINNTGVFYAINLNDTGVGSLREAITSAINYGCGEAIVDATALSGTINWGVRQNMGPSHDITILGSGPDQIIIDGGGAGGFLYNYGNGNLKISGFQIINCEGEEIVYKPNDGDLTIENCWFDNNTHRTIYFVNTSGSFHATNSTFSNNTSTSGTMYFPNIEGTVDFSNCTFYNNSSSSTAGVFYAANVQGGLFLNNCTLLNNSCPTGTGGIQSLGGSCTAINTTFENTPKDFTGSISMNHSHMNNTTGCTISGSNNILNVSANLSSLGNNGGSTPTCSLIPGSPLINAGTANLVNDQRGFCRTNTSDIGAFEYNGIQDTVAPIPVLAVLPNVVFCSGTEVTTLTYPTATENCASVITITHDACLPISTLGTTVLTWTYDDGHGNTTTQTQNVVIGVTVNVNVTQVGSLLTAVASGATYQWLDCDNGNSPINGETNQTYTPAITGNYAVEITENGCVDTSSCFLVDYTGLDNLVSASVLVYPNPSNDGNFHIELDGKISAVVLYDVLGRIIEAPFNAEQGTLDASFMDAGKYLISIQSNEGIFIAQIMITK